MADKNPQRQDSLEDQLRTVMALAVKAGCYDAADYLQRTLYPEPSKNPCDGCLPYMGCVNCRLQNRGK